MFESSKVDVSYFKGDSDSYFPLEYAQRTVFWGKIPVALEKSGYYNAIDNWFSYNDLTIDDNILTYETRSTKFINYLRSNEYRGR